MLQYTLENHTISKMISDINDYVIDFIMNTLEVEKQHITEKKYPSIFTRKLGSFISFHSSTRKRCWRSIFVKFPSYWYK